MAQPVEQTFGVKVENIDHTITEASLYSLFKDYGSIESVKIPDKSKSWGFVNFFNEEDATNAVSFMNKKYANGRELTVTLQSLPINITDCKFGVGCKKKVRFRRCKIFESYKSNIYAACKQHCMCDEHLFY